MPALIPSLWFETVRLDWPHQADRHSVGSVSPSRKTSFQSGIQNGTTEIGSAVRRAQPIGAVRSPQTSKAKRSAQFGDPLSARQWQCVDEKELRR
jgi:hypothetical protein